MKLSIQRIGVAATLTGMLGLAGCGDSSNPVEEDPIAKGIAAANQNAHGHSHGAGGHPAHASHGPHEGRLVELGRDHKFVAEIVTSEDKQTVQVYIYDHDLRPAAVASTGVTLNLISKGVTEVFNFQPLTYGVSASEYMVIAPKLWECLEHESWNVAQLSVLADGETRVGRLDHHDHAHAGGTHRH